MDNPYTAENMGELAEGWAELVMEAKRHVAEHHERDPNTEIYNPVGGAICQKAWLEACEIHQVLYMDAAVASVITLLVDLRLTNPTMTSASIMQNFDALIAAQRHMLQTFMWEADNKGHVDDLDPTGGIGEAQGNA